jgi:predicted ATPase/DNA-binding SARP family transcriptional activator
VAEVRIQLTGGVRVTAPDGRTFAGSQLPGRQGRLVLAYLAAERRPVPRDALAEAVWPAGPPANWKRDLSVLASKLRALLRAVDPDRPAVLVWSEGCYELRLPAGWSVDAGLAAARADEARRALDNGDTRAALDAATTTVSIARRPLLPDEDATWLDRHRDRLQRARLAGLDVAAEASRERGDLAGAVAYAAEAVEVASFREDGYVTLMRLQLAAGDRAEALRTYERCRRLLADELGVDPSPATQAVFVEALRCDHPPTTAFRFAAPNAAVSSTNLPVRLTSFVGREHDTNRVAAALAAARLVTLWGVGGVGKSRLAIECAAGLASGYRDGVWQCELSRVASADAVAHALGAALRVTEGGSPTIEGRLVEFLSGRQLLLVMDNCEHLVDAVARLVGAVLTDCPGVSVLATSRERLSVDGEHLVPVEPLPLPASGTEAFGAARPAAVRLFAERAGAACHGFAITPDNAAAVADICRRLDGLPLAIELAAARLRTLSVHELADRLDQRFRLLTGGPRLASPHHRTLRATVDWSYALLDPQQRRVLEHLSVFAGTFTIDAAAAVCGDPEDGTEDVLAALVDRSMVVADTTGTKTRFQLLETMRVYARERLEARSQAAVARSRHADHYLAVAETVTAQLYGPDEVAAAAALDADWDEMRAAHRLVLARKDTEPALRLAAALYWYALFGMNAEAPAWAARAVDLTQAHTHPLFPAATGTAGVGCWMRGDLAAATAFGTRGLAAAGKDPSLRFPLDVLGAVALFEGRLDDALNHFTEAATAAANTNDYYHHTHLLGDIALVHAYQGRHDMARHVADQARRVAHATANPSATAWSLYVDGEIRLTRDPDGAAALLDSSIELARAVGSSFTVGVALVSASSVRARHGDPNEARRTFREVVDHWHALGNWTQQWITLRNVVELLLRIDALEAAATLFGAVQAAHTVAPAYGADARRLDAARHELDRALGTGRVAAAILRGEQMTPDDAVAFAHAELRPVAPIEHTQPSR